MDYYQTEIRKIMLDYVDYLYLEYLPMNLYLQYLENFMNLNAKNVVQLISIIHFNMTFIDSVFNNLYTISGFHTLGVRGKSI